MSLPSPHHRIVRQVMAAMLQRRPFDASLSPSPLFRGWSSDAVLDVLSSVPSVFFQIPSSVGRQSSSRRHRSPLRQRNIRLESTRRPLGPAARRDLDLVVVGVAKALEFYRWVEIRCGFAHDERTCRAMSLVIARSNSLGKLWHFLRSNKALVGAATVTTLIKLLGEEGLANEALALFYRMKQLQCKPDVVAYNAVIASLCSVGDGKRARFLLQKMELPGARCPPDVYTYTILIGFYCKRGMQTGSRKAIRRRIWVANHMFRHMVFKGFAPDVVTYNCLIDGLCKTCRIGRALELFDEMPQRGCSPNKVTYNSFIRFYSAVNEVDNAIKMMRDMVERGLGVPTSSSYTPIIHALCETGRIKEARSFLEEMMMGGSVPREYTYKLVLNALDCSPEEGLSDSLRKTIEDGIETRFRQVERLKVVMKRS